MEHDVKYQELNDEQLEQVVGGALIDSLIIAPQTNLNLTNQVATAVATSTGWLGGAAAGAANYNATGQGNNFSAH